MRNAECFMQVDVRNVCPDLGWLGNSDLGIQVCSVHIHLPPVLMDGLTDIFHRLLINPMS